MKRTRFAFAGAMTGPDTITQTDGVIVAASYAEESHTAFTDCENLRLLFANGHAFSDATFHADNSTGAAITLKAVLSYFNGGEPNVFTPIRFDGERAGVTSLGAGDIVWSDPIAKYINAGRFGWRVYITIASGKTLYYTRRQVSGDFGTDPNQHTGGATGGSPSQSDITTGPNANYLNGGGTSKCSYGPIAGICDQVKPKLVFAIGHANSLENGASTSDGISFVHRAFNALNIPCGWSSANSGTEISDQLAYDPFSEQFAEYADVWVLGFDDNAIYNGKTVAAIKATMLKSAKAAGLGGTNTIVVRPPLPRNTDITGATLTAQEDNRVILANWFYDGGFEADYGFGNVYLVDCNAPIEYNASGVLTRNGGHWRSGAPDSDGIHPAANDTVNLIRNQYMNVFKKILASSVI